MDGEFHWFAQEDWCLVLKEKSGDVGLAGVLVAAPTAMLRRSSAVTTYITIC